MSKYEIISIGTSVVAIIISITAFVISNNKSKKALSLSKKANQSSEDANGIAKEANKTSVANLEFIINETIRGAYKDVMSRNDLVMPLLVKKTNGELSHEEKEAFNYYKETVIVANESYINAYEEACAKYLDNKTDKTRFKKNYFISLRQLVEKEEYKPFFDSTTSRYKAILKVYNEWNDLEQ